MTARRLAKAGCAVVLAARDVVACEQAAEVLRREGADAAAHRVDVRDEASVAALYADTVDMYDRLDLCVNNAGGVLDADADPISTSLDTWRLALNST